VLAAALALAYAAVTSATQPDLARVQDPIPYPTVFWMVPQLLPSPEVVFGGNASGGARAGLRWQVTPLLYSFGLNRKITPWRFLVVDPLARQNGSVEIYFSPEYIAAGGAQPDALVARTGVRSYFPILARGESLSVSLGSSVFLYEGRAGAAFEGGVYTLSGILGLQLTYSPSNLPAEWIATFRVRYF
jgi:hypothetical protein